MRAITLAILSALTLISHSASAEVLILNCVYPNKHNWDDQMVLNLDTDRKIFAFTYMGYQGNIGFVEMPQGGFGNQYSYIKIDRSNPVFTTVGVHILGGNQINPVFRASAELTLENIPPIHYKIKASRVSYGGSENGYPAVKAFVGAICNVVPTDK